MHDVDSTADRPGVRDRRRARRWRLIPGVSRSGGTIVGGDGDAGSIAPAAAEFTFFLAMPTMAAAFAHRSAGRSATTSTSAQASEIAVGFVMAFVVVGAGRQAVPQLRPALGVSAVRLVPHRGGLVLLAALAAGWGR